MNVKKYYIKNMEPKIEFLKKCDICNSYAKSLCYECLSYYCDSCFKLIHEKEKNSKHKKEELDPYIPIDLKCRIHTKNPLNLFCLEEKGKYHYYIIPKYNIELCCAYCYFKNLHDKHKILEISDEENLNKENISIATSMNEFDKIINKANELKEKIEKEINEINKLYDKTVEDLTKDFKQRKEDLEREELKLKEN